MFAFITKFKTEVRTFISEITSKVSALDTKIETEFADLKKKIEAHFGAESVTPPTEAPTAGTTGASETPKAE